MDTSTQYITCPCNICQGHIEFLIENVDGEIECPHCGCNTHLFKPSHLVQTHPESKKTESKTDSPPKQPTSDRAGIETPPMPTPTKVPTVKDVTPPSSAPSMFVGITSGQGWLIVVILVLGLFVVPYFHSVFSQVTPQQQWEYQIVAIPDYSFDRRIGELGSGGWELVFARRASDEGSSTFSYEMIFKRPKKL